MTVDWPSPPPSPVCQVPPEGYMCTRAAGHNGPCAAIPTAPIASPWDEDTQNPRGCLGIILGSLAVVGALIGAIAWLG